MKNYTEMTKEEIFKIVNRGGDDLRELNKAVLKHLNNLKLSERAEEVIANTDANSIVESFGGLFTAEEIENYIAENYPDED